MSVKTAPMLGNRTDQVGCDAPIPRIPPGSGVAGDIGSSLSTQQNASWTSLIAGGSHRVDGGSVSGQVRKPAGQGEHHVLDHVHPRGSLRLGRGWASRRRSRRGRSHCSRTQENDWDWMRLQAPMFSQNQCRCSRAACSSWLTMAPAADRFTFHTVAGALATRTRNTPVPTAWVARYSSAIRCLRSPALAVHDRHVVGLAPRLHPPGEPTGHAHQVGVVQLLIRAVVQPPPPRAEPAGRVTHREVGVEHHPVDAVIVAIHQIAVAFPELIGHPQTVSEPAPSDERPPKGPPIPGEVPESA